MTSWWWWWCHDNDVMIATTLHWLLLAMWHANHLINSHVIDKSENYTLPKKHETRFYEWNGAFWTLGQIWVKSFRWNPCMPSLHHMSPFGKYRHQLFTISFHESPWFHFLAGALKNVLSRRFSPFWARVGRVTGTKQLFCHGLNSWIWINLW